MDSTLIALTKDTFDEEIAGADLPVVVDFWAEWCGPCRMVAPVLAQIASEQDGKLLIRKLNVDDAPEIAQRFGIMSIPTMLVFKDGELRKRLIGAKGKGQLMAEFSEFIVEAPTVVPQVVTTASSTVAETAVSVDEAPTTR